jgi:hypothetical protein
MSGARAKCIFGACAVSRARGSTRCAGRNVRAGVMLETA